MMVRRSVRLALPRSAHGESVASRIEPNPMSKFVIGGRAVYRRGHRSCRRRDGSPPARWTSTRVPAVADEWAEPAPLQPSKPFASSQFGYSVALNKAGTTLAVGAPFESARGAVYVFAHSSDEWGGEVRLLGSTTSPPSCAAGSAPEKSRLQPRLTLQQARTASMSLGAMGCILSYFACARPRRQFYPPVPEEPSKMYAAPELAVSLFDWPSLPLPSSPGAPMTKLSPL